MPRDAEFGRELAAWMTEQYSGLIKEVEFTYDPFLELDQLDPARPYCKIAPMNYDSQRESRINYMERITLELALVSAVAPTGNPAWVDQWLDSWDMVLRQIRNHKLFKRHPPISVETDQRYDFSMFHNNHRLLTQASLNYHNVEIV
jgi:hypothetical protein